MTKENIKINARLRRRMKIRAKIRGTSECPRLSVFKSNAGMYLQLIDDSNGKTLASAHSREVKKKTDKGDLSFQLGRLIGEKAIAKKITNVVFDRGGYRYHGRIKSAADGAREAGLIF